MTSQSCQPIGTDIFNAENRRRCEKYVRSMQGKLDQAVADNNKEKIRWYVHLLSKRSRAVKVLAAYHVTTENKGRHTAGVDGVKMVRGRRDINDKTRMMLLSSIDIKKKPSPIKRVFIRKPNGKKRPLGISTLLDRIIQCILLLTLEPITEYHASDNSYGFRPKRSCHDAISHLFTKLSRRNNRQWILEGDIRGCFDNISHDHILNTLKAWNTPNNVISVIRRMLKSKVFCEGELYDIENGTPQGSLLSPTLANVALTALDDYCSNEFGRKHHRGKINPLVRYADDFVIICESEQEAISIKEKIANVLRSNIGLELSEEKTKITHISEGFNFLGFNIRKYTEKSLKSKHHERGKLLIKPQKEKVTNCLRRIQTVLDNNKTAKAETIIRLLNPMLQGFAIYYRFTVSKRTFSHIKHALSQKLWRWAKRRHPSKPKRWIFRKYFTVKEDKGRKGILKSETGDTIINVELIPIVRFVKVKSEMRIHARDEQTREYWQNREYTNALSHIYSFKVEKLYKKQKGICPCCGNIITKDEIGQNIVHMHHMLPRSEGGTDRLNNLRLLHLSCHQKAHSVLTRNQMAYLMKRKLNYILQRNIDHFQGNPNAINSIQVVV